MEIYQDLNALGGKPVGAVTVGNFDGLHLGHQALLELLTKNAGPKGSLVVTFEPHPREVLQPGVKVPRLMTPPHFQKELEALGVSRLLVLPFDESLKNTSAADFMAGLWKAAPFEHLVEGYDFVLGAGREGDRAFLEKWCAKKSVKFHQVSAVSHKGETVSSHRIRELLQEGEVEKAAGFLGRPFLVEAEVERGDQRGRLLHFPTANLKIPETLVLPKRGVYAGRARVKGVEHVAVANLGKRPTFHSSSALLLEVHLLDFSDDLYGERMEFEFVHYLREEKKFSSKEELVEQIAKDVAQTRSRMKE
jgi:riboflavin kinase/FMN adenylyltransferase